jgi:hypothetical protein
MKQERVHIDELARIIDQRVSMTAALKRLQ